MFLDQSQDQSTKFLPEFQENLDLKNQEVNNFTT